MRNWTIRPGGLFILLGLLSVILLILVLPQVDLLDTAFQRDSAPTTIHSQATAARIILTANVAANSLASVQQWEAHPQRAIPSGSAVANFRPILLCSIRC
jgi:hypothetical protein